MPLVLTRKPGEWVTVTHGEDVMRIQLQEVKSPSGRRSLKLVFDDDAKKFLVLRDEVVDTEIRHTP